MRVFCLCVVLFLLAGCRTHHSSYKSYIPSQKWQSGIVYSDGLDRTSTNLSDEDYRQIEKILCHIPVLGDPVQVIQFFSVSDRGSIWCFRCINSGAYIDVFVARDYNLFNSPWFFVVTNGGVVSL